MREQAAGAHEIARLLVACTKRLRGVPRDQASEAEAGVLQALETEAGVLQDLMLMAFQTLRRSTRHGANYEDSLVSMQQIFACVANYSFFDAEAVVDCGAPQLLVSVFATHDATEVNSWLLTEPVLRDERLHEFALVAIYNLRARPEVMLLLADARSREALELAGWRLDHLAASGEARAALREDSAANCVREVLVCLQNFDGGCAHLSTAAPDATATEVHPIMSPRGAPTPRGVPDIPIVMMQCEVPPGAAAGSKVAFMTPTHRPQDSHSRCRRFCPMP